MRPDTATYRDLFLNDLPMIDTRAPVEYKKGAFPHTLNLPLMNDVERQKIGTCYKLRGQQAAIDLGHQLVSGTVKAERIEAWAAFAKANPDGYMYCFRGGLRSQIAQQWLKTDAGIAYPRVVGGYKAMRTFLMDTLDAAVAECGFVIVGGMTGTGKTDVLARVPNAIDLEQHANHRGSSFGKRALPQPGQIDFENNLAIDLLKRRHAGVNQFVVEDESRLIGACALPLSLHKGMQQFPIVWLEDSLEGRVERILRDYVVDLYAEFDALHGPDGFARFSERMLQSLDNIYKRLGGERHQRLSIAMKDALDEQARSGSTDLHRVWIAGLLSEYYDPMYAFQRESKADRIEFAGEQDAVVQYLTERYAQRR